MVNLSAPFAKSEVHLQRPDHHSQLVGAGRPAMDCPRGGGGRVIKLFDKLPINLQLQGFYNALPPARPRPCQLCSQLTSSSERDIS